MEELLLALIILILAVLSGVVAMLVRTISKLKDIEKTSLQHTEAGLRSEIDKSLPANMQVGFEEILKKHQAYLDELLRTTTNSFDKKIHRTLDVSVQNQLEAYQKAIDAQQEKMLAEMKELNKSLNTKKQAMSSELLAIDKEISARYRKRLEEKFADLAWQYIAESLSQSVDLHSQKEAIFDRLEKTQKQLKKDYADANKITT